MAKTAAKKTVGNNKRKLLHIYRFRERYEFDASGHIDRFKTGPLKYVKMFIGCGDDDESILFYKQKCALKAYKNYDTFFMIYGELLNLAAYQSLDSRGYIVDGLLRAADIKTIAGSIGREVKIVSQAVKALLEVGLIEYVPLREFKAVKRRRKFPAETGKQPAKHRKKHSKNDERTITSINRTRKSKTETKGFETEFEKWKAAEKVEISHQSQSQSKAQGKPSPNPKHNPTVSEALGERPLYVKVGAIPPETVFKEDINIQAMAFASEVYRLLKWPYPPGSKACRQELFNYYHAWLDAIKARLPRPVLTSLWLDSIKSAKRIGDNKDRKGGYKKRGAGWRSEFNKNSGIYPTGRKTK